MEFVDMRLGVQEEAFKIAEELNKAKLPDIAHVETHAWYNGRERGIALTFRSTWYDKELLVVTFGECRNSDQLFIDHWTMRGKINGPDVSDLTDEAYAARVTVDSGEYGRAAGWVTRFLAEWLLSRHI